MARGWALLEWGTGGDKERGPPRCEGATDVEQVIKQVTKQLI